MAIINIGSATNGKLARPTDKLPADRGGGNVYVSAAPPRIPFYRASKWYFPYQQTRRATGGAFAGGTLLRMVPVFIEAPVSIQAVGIRVLTLSAAGTFGMGFYAADPATLLPTGTPLRVTPTSLSTGAVAPITSALGTVAAPGTPDPLVIAEPGIYYQALMVDNATAAFSAVSGEVPIVSSLIGVDAFATSNAGSATTCTCLSYTVAVHGTWPDVSAVSPNFIANNQSFIFDFQVAA